MLHYDLQKVTIDDEVFFSAFVEIGKDWNGFVLPYFMLDEAHRLCHYLNDMKTDKWVVINSTDGIIASEILTKAAAEIFIKEFPLRFKNQGFYLTSNNEKIKPNDVKLDLQAVEDDESFGQSYFDENSDKFVILEQIDGDVYEAVEYKGEDITVNGKEKHVYPIGTGSWIWSVDTQLN